MLYKPLLCMGLPSHLAMLRNLDTEVINSSYRIKCGHNTIYGPRGEDSHDSGFSILVEKCSAFYDIKPTPLSSLINCKSHYSVLSGVETLIFRDYFNLLENKIPLLLPMLCPYR